MKIFSTRRYELNNIAARVAEIYPRAELLRAEGAKFVSRGEVERMIPDTDG